MAPPLDVSLVLPIYNAEAFLRQNLEEIDTVLNQAQENWELILVLDASTDGSEALCRDFAAQPRPYVVQVISNEKNLGKGGSIQRGMAQARGRYRLFNDCDLAYPMSEVLKVLGSLKKGHPLAVASRSVVGSRYVFAPHNFRYLYTRHVASRFLNFLIRRIFIPSVKDTQAGLKGFQAPVADFLFRQLKLKGFSFDLELLHIAHRAGIPAQEIPVDLYAQRVSTVNFPVEVLRMVRDIFRILLWTSQGKYQFSMDWNKAEAAKAS